ncbi:hypothetical protein H6G96_39260 [Nostoc sp. FACHB-892]|nr:hypothetical protein [Nostoc sp. FACHB-892]
MLSKIVEGMLSHREQLKIHLIHQNFLRCAVFSKNRSSQEMGNTIKELLSALTIDERLAMMLKFEINSSVRLFGMASDLDLAMPAVNVCRSVAISCTAQECLSLTKMTCIEYYRLRDAKNSTSQIVPLGDGRTLTPIKQPQNSFRLVPPQHLIVQIVPE